MTNYTKQNNRFKNLENKIKKLEEDKTTQGKLIEDFLNLKHEISRINSLILNMSEELNATKIQPNNAKRISEISNTIFHSSSIISARMLYLDLELNPSALIHQSKFTSVIYKKFDKARYVLHKLAKEQRKKISFKGRSQYAISTIAVFDCLPFILLDNAIKYAPNDTEITVTFDEVTNPSIHQRLEVVISSIGPFVMKEEIGKLTERGYRNPNAVATQTIGYGLGLYIAQQLCDMYNINMKIQSIKNPSIKINGIEYGTFEVSLQFQQA